MAMHAQIQLMYIPTLRLSVSLSLFLCGLGLSLCLWGAMMGRLQSQGTRQVN
jgi:hypothetical protein